MSIPNRIAILNSDGTTDTSFAPDYGLNAAGRWVSVLSNGNLMAGGDFTQYDEHPRSNLVVVGQDGVAVNPPVNGNNDSYVGMAQTDGKAIVAGAFTQVASVARNRIARIQSDLVVEDAYNPNSNALVYATANQGDGKTIIGGLFTSVGGTARNFIARLYNDEADSTLSVITADLVRWLRGGSMQETQTVEFAVSTDGGTTYTDVPGTLTAIAGGWDFVPDTTLTTSGLMRGRAYTTDSHSEGIQETVVSFSVDPEIEVSVNGTVLEDGVSTVDFDDTQVGTTTPITVAISNVGLADLNLTNGPNHVQISGTNANQWSLTAQPTTPVAPGQSVTFQLVFDPTTSGSKTATVTINNDDADEDPFTFTITGEATPGPGTLDDTWVPVANSTANGLATDSSDNSYPFGNFTTLNAVAVGRYAKLNSSAVLQPRAGSGANADVRCYALLASGKTLIGGTFTTVHGVSKPRIARLNADGTLDSSFSLSTTGTGINAIVPASDGSVYVGGSVTAIGGRTTHLARLTSSGTFDSAFSAVFTTGVVLSIALQEDNKILVGGLFYVNGSSSMYYLVRLNTDGSLDTSFTSPTLTLAGQVQTISVQADGKIIVSTTNASTSVRRLNTDGSLDSSFVPASNSSTGLSTIVQTDTKVLVLRSASSGALTRLLADDGAEDGTFIADASGTLIGLAVQTDGKVLVGGGGMTFAGGTPRNLARLYNDNDATSSVLSVVSAAHVQWLRGGTLPETTQVVFRYYPTGSATAVTLGQGTRIDGGWELSGISLPISGTLSAYALVPCGRNNGSSSFIEETVAFSSLPVADLAIEYPVGTTIADGGTVTYPGTLPGQNTDRVFTLRNTGNASLSSISASVGGEWSITSAPAATLAAGGTTTMTVRFTPTGTNQRGPVTLSVSSTVPGTKNPYTILLYGNGVGLPTCTTGSNSSAGVGARNLSGTFKANHDTAVAYFEYKLSASTTWLTSATQSTSGFSNVTLNSTVSGLTVGQVYQYRAVIYNAVNATSPTVGATSTFTA
jgi:uncharacterized delta-60 repeat protein